jgi:hypothetical protein
MAVIAELLEAPELLDIQTAFDVQDHIDAFKRLGVRAGNA